ncbi:MAG: lysophospholipid acyltransferase family protein [Bacteroidia bacterium]|nr:lysophospholipid acyltransferase family protein [Bacteroidia bacterium]
MFDKIFNAILAFLVNAIYGPVVIYKDESMKGRHRLAGPSIIVSNHTCHLDGPIINAIFRKEKIHTLAAKDRFEQKGFGFFLRHSYCIPIDRQNADTSWVHESIRILKEGKGSIAIYPEGRHGAHRQQLPFHQGVAMLSFFVDVPIVVIYQDGPHKPFHRSRLIVDAPMTLPKDGGLTPEALAANTGLLQRRVKELMEELADED